MIEVRNAKLEDAADIARVHKNSWLTTYRGIILDTFLDKIVDRYNSGDSEQRRVDTINKDGGRSTFVAEFDGKIVGFVDGGLNRFDETPFETEIYAIYIEKRVSRKRYWTQANGNFY